MGAACQPSPLSLPCTHLRQCSNFSGVTNSVTSRCLGVGCRYCPRVKMSTPTACTGHQYSCHCFSAFGACGIQTSNATVSQLRVSGIILFPFFQEASGFYAYGSSHATHQRHRQRQAVGEKGARTGGRLAQLACQVMARKRWLLTSSIQAKRMSLLMRANINPCPPSANQRICHKQVAAILLPAGAGTS